MKIPNVRLGNCVQRKGILGMIGESTDLINNKKTTYIELNAKYCAKESPQEIARVINHEIIHIILDKLEGQKTNYAFDNIHNKWNYALEVYKI